VEYLPEEFAGTSAADIPSRSFSLNAANGGEAAAVERNAACLAKPFDASEMIEIRRTADLHEVRFHDLIKQRHATAIQRGQRSSRQRKKDASQKEGESCAQLDRMAIDASTRRAFWMKRLKSRTVFIDAGRMASGFPKPPDVSGFFPTPEVRWRN
jgi:hypothetical protein